MLYTEVCVILISGKFPITVSQVLLEVLRMEKQWCDRNQSSLHPQKFKHWDQHFMKPGHSEQNLLARHCTLIKVWGVNEHKGCKQRLSMVKVHRLLLCQPFLYSILCV